MRKAQIFMTIFMTIFISFNSSSEIRETEMDKQQLTTKQQSMIPIAAFTASGDLGRLKESLNEGLEQGLTINEIKEILVQMYAYSGFPRSLNGITTFMQLIDERKEKGIQDEVGEAAAPLPLDKSSLILGTEIQTYLVGAPVSGSVMQFSPEIDQFLKAHLFGDIFGRNNLDYQSREIATIAALSSIDGLDNQLRSHIQISMNIGLTATQIQTIANVLYQKVGQKQATVLNTNILATKP